MATLERIRRRSGLLIIVIGFAMAAFILTDLLGSGRSIFSDNNSIGKIDGHRIDRMEFSRRIAELEESNPQYGSISELQKSNFVWNQYLREIIMGEEYEELGLTVTADELRYDMMNNPQVQQIQLFQDQNTGQVTEESYTRGLNYLLDNREQNAEIAKFWNQWIAFQQSVKDQSLVFKYNNAVEKGLYTPAALARADYVAGSQTYSISFIQMPYAAINDSSITVTDGDKKAWYSAHKDEFKQKAVRNIVYLDFPITASEADKQEVIDDLNKIKEGTFGGENSEGFGGAENDSAYAAMYSDQPIDRAFYAKEKLPPVLDTVFFDAEIGTMVGPYEMGSGYSVSKLSAIKFLPDSVKARHILIAYQGAERSQATRTPQEAKELADSLFAVLEADKSKFDEISTTYNDDAVASTKGGDLGYFQQGMMAQPFNDYCFYNSTGDMGLVPTNFGFHIIDITAQKGSNKSVQVTSIYRSVLVSDATMKSIYKEASTFASEAQRAEDYNALAEEKGYQLRPATDIEAIAEQIPGLGASREVVRWAWDEERKEGDVGLIDLNSKNYVVVILTDQLEEGYTPMDKVMGKVTQGVLNEKKGAQLIGEIEAAMGNSTDINQIAQALNTTVKTQSINRKSTALPGAGSEPEIIGAMAGSAPNELSKPMAGKMAAYLFVVTAVSEAYDKQDYKEEQNSLNQDKRNRVASQTFESIKKGKKVTDNRALFY